jgi:hypothetical protein
MSENLRAKLYKSIAKVLKKSSKKANVLDYLQKTFLTFYLEGKIRKSQNDLGEGEKLHSIIFRERKSNDLRHTQKSHIRIIFLQHPLNFNFIFILPSRSHWDALLKSVRCEIISFTRNEQIDAYVLR